jgi:hypothetical protein
MSVTCGMHWVDHSGMVVEGGEYRVSGGKAWKIGPICGKDGHGGLTAGVQHSRWCSRVTSKWEWEGHENITT